METLKNYLALEIADARRELYDLTENPAVTRAHAVKVATVRSRINALVEVEWAVNAIQTLEGNRE